MKIRFENSYWPNAVGFAAFMFALALMVRSCNEAAIEGEKTRQLEISKEQKK